MYAKLAKLRRMTPREIKQRLAHKLHASKERKAWRTGSREWANQPLDFARVLSRAETLCPGLAQDWAEHDAAFTSNQDPCHFVLLGHEFDLSGEIDWHTDPRSGYGWPRKFYADLKLYNLENGADIKYPWELSRHQFFLHLLHQKDAPDLESAGVHVCQIWEDWIDQNPLYEGVNWTSGLEVAMRAISWVFTLSKIGHTKATKARLDKIVKSLADHAHYLTHHFSYYSSPYNHLIGESSALYMLSEILAEHQHALAWKSQARKALVTYGPQQFYEDGFCVEQAMSYHYYTLGFLTLALIAARRFSQPIEEIEPVVHNAFQTGLSFRRPNGRWPYVGDLDSARALPVHGTDLWNFDGLNHAAALLFEDPSLAAQGDEPGEELKALFGHDGVRTWTSLRSETSHCSPKLKVLEDSGYVLASDEKDWMLFDAGPIAKGLFPDATPSTAHGHADTLQLLYFSGDDQVLEDSGIPFYNGDPEWIRHFRSQAAHNTVEISGAELVRSEGRLAWSREVARPLITADLSNDVWMCSGTLEWPEVTHQRCILGKPGTGIWVADLLKTDTPRACSWYWQLPSGANENNDSTATLAQWGAIVIERWSSSPSASTIFDLAESMRPEAWRCPGYGLQEPGTRLQIQQEVEGIHLSLTFIGKCHREELSVAINGLVAGPEMAPERLLTSWTHGDCNWQTFVH